MAENPLTRDQGLRAARWGVPEWYAGNGEFGYCLMPSLAAGRCSHSLNEGHRAVQGLGDRRLDALVPVAGTRHDYCHDLGRNKSESGTPTRRGYFPGPWPLDSVDKRTSGLRS